MSYNLQQQAFAVSTLSNLVGGVKGRTEPELQDLLDVRIAERLTSNLFQTYTGKWKRVWGPVVYVKDQDDVADNTMFAAQNEATNDIVVGIAGTNGVSELDIIEDMDVYMTHEFPNASAGTWVAKGAWDGVTALEGMVD